ncbi:pirin family protein [uncultured Aquitalea sp.]|uniref:pirin family protein n=1 Tax=uncultured Aquitalea sp. TaxID=540272 RepID=UPI0025FD12C6|nr:pirin family protein [uncultured Aquitalea sp.]
MTQWALTVTGKESDIGFIVRRLLPTRAARHIGPFIFLDHMGPAHFADAGTEGDVRPHPHIGLATLTYLFDGAFMHRDSLGSVQRIEPGAANLMIAGRGIVHSERVPAEVRATGGKVEGIQLWLALPVALEECEPAFHHVPAADLPQLEAPGARIRVILGEAWGLRSPVPFPAPALYAAAELEAGAALSVPEGFAERGVYVASGAVTLDGHPLAAGELGLLSPCDNARLVASDNTRLLILAGPEPDAPRYLDWNFVSSRRERIAQARDDWQANRFPAIPGETERIPLPGSVV